MDLGLLFLIAAAVAFGIAVFRSKFRDAIAWGLLLWVLATLLGGIKIG